MRRILFWLFLTTAWATCANEPAWRWDARRVPDPGFDLDAAQVIRVTNLDGKGRGSLAAALASAGPRLVIFEVGGVIDLGGRSIEIREPDVFVAGQTAPEPGITLIRGGIEIAASRVVLQHLRVRPGDADKTKGSDWTPDGISTRGAISDVWIDHCSATWGIDENISATSYGAPEGTFARRIVIRHCIIAEGLNQATHHKGGHSKGTLVLDGTKQVAIVGNLYANNVERNPLFKPDTSGVVVNNLICNPGQRALHASVPAPESKGVAKARITVVGNVVLLGPTSKKTAAVAEGAADWHFRDNAGFSYDGRPIAELREPGPTLPEPPLWPEGLEARPATATTWLVARTAGARPACRDPIDQRIVSEAILGRGRIIDSQNQVGGYPACEPTSRAIDVPDTGHRAWLEKLAHAVERSPLD